MRVILKDNISNLGNVGDIVDVKPGYARNYLLPKGLVLVADEGNVKAWEHQQRIIRDRIRKMRLDAESFAKELAGKKVEVTAKAGEGDRLFGSVGGSDIQQALRKQGFQVSRKDIQLERPIKILGTHQVSVRLHPEVTCKITVEIVRSADSPEPSKSRTAEILAAAEAEEKAAKEAAAEAEEAEEPGDEEE